MGKIEKSLLGLRARSVRIAYDFATRPEDPAGQTAIAHVDYGVNVNWLNFSLTFTFEDAARFGYDYIELWGGYPHAFAEDLRAGGVSQITRLSERYHVPVRCFTPEHNGYPYNYMAGDGTQWERSMAYLELCTELTAAMGARYMLISAGHAGYRADRRAIESRLCRSLARLAAKAEKELQSSASARPCKIKCCRSYSRRMLWFPSCAAMTFR